MKENAKGKQCTDRQSIADIFASFYEDLYSSRMPPDAVAGASMDAHTEPIPPFSKSELLHGLKGLKAGRARDANGVLAEMHEDAEPDEPIEGHPRRCLITEATSADHMMCHKPFNPIARSASSCGLSCHSIGERRYPSENV